MDTRLGIEPLAFHTLNVQNTSSKCKMLLKKSGCFEKMSWVFVRGGFCVMMDVLKNRGGHCYERVGYFLWLMEKKGCVFICFL